MQFVLSFWAVRVQAQDNFNPRLDQRTHGYLE